MNNLWLRIKAAYTNLPGSVKITGNTIISMILSKYFLSITNDVILIDPFWKDIVLYGLTGLIAWVNNEALKFRNSDVVKVDSIDNLNVIVEETSPTQVKLTK